MLVCARCGSTYTRSQEFCGLDGQPLEVIDPLPLIGRTIDRYEIVGVIGSGGMAMVYLALHTRLEKHFAFKALHGQMASDTMLAKRFHREAKVLSRLSHPNIVSVTDFGSSEHGIPYMVMERLEGDSLWVRSRDEGPIPPPKVAEWALQIASGLDLAHRKGFVHRDLKPQNIMLAPNPDGDGELVKILDFGLVGIVEPDPAQHTQLTQEGMFFGTPAYMSPEQITGGEVKATADLYALGVLMYLLLTGEVPFRGDVRELAHQHVSSDPSRPLLEYGGLTPIVMQLLQKDPARRFSSARALMRAIDETGLLGRSLDLSPSLGEDTRVDRTPPAEFEDEDEGPQLTFSEQPPEEGPRAERRPVPRRTAASGWWWASAAVVLATVVGLRFGWDRVLSSPTDPAAQSEAPADKDEGAATENADPPEARAEASSPGAAGRGRPGHEAPAPEATKRPPPPDVRARPGTGPSSPARPPAAREDGGAGSSKAVFASLDEALTAEIARSGVAWSDVEAESKQAAFQWGAWYRDPSGADPQAMRRTQAKLMATVARLEKTVPDRDPGSSSEKAAAAPPSRNDTASRKETAPSKPPEGAATRNESAGAPAEAPGPAAARNEKSPSPDEGSASQGETPDPDPMDPTTEDALDRSLEKLQTETSTRATP